MQTTTTYTITIYRAETAAEKAQDRKEVRLAIGILLGIFIGLPTLTVACYLLGWFGK